MLKKLLGAVLLVVLLAAVALAVIDVTVRILVEERAAREVAEAVPEARQVDVRVSSFPFLGRVLLRGRIERVTAELREYRKGGVEVSWVQLVVDGLRIDRDVLVEDHKLVISGLDRARAEAHISAAAASRSLGTPVAFVDEDRVQVIVAGTPIVVHLTLEERTVNLRSPGLSPLALRLPGRDVLPCDPRAKVESGLLVVHCSFAELPPALARALR